MRPVLRSSERGSAIAVVLIVTIMILVAFIAMWFMQKDDLENAQKSAAAAATQKNNTQAALTAVLQYAENLSRLVGAQNKAVEDMMPKGDPKDPKVPDATGMGAGIVVSNLDVVQAHLKHDGTIPGEGGAQTPGTLNWLKNSAFIEIAAEARTGKEEAVRQSAADFSWMKPEFKTKLGEYAALMSKVPPAPKSPLDPDDAAAKADYDAKLKAYEASMAEVRKVSEDLAGMEGYKRFNEIIQMGGKVVVDEAGVVRLVFYQEPAEAQPTVLSLLASIPPTITRMKSEFAANKKADLERVTALEADKKALEEAVQTTRTELEAEQGRHTADVQQLQKELQDANAKVEANRVEATQAINKVQQLEEDMKRKEVVATREISARDERIRQEKARRDLQIRRDDEDGSVLSTSPTMRTATINLGSADRVFVGLKFSVSAWGRGGLREKKGEVAVTRVTGAHSAQVAILGEVDAQNPIVQGDFVHNPLYSPTEEVHVHIVGTLQKWPRPMLVERLRRLGVAVDEQMTGQTDYVVVPDSMAAPAPAAPAAEGEEAPEAPKPGQSELEKIQSQARTFGAVVITESLLDSFLNF